MLQMDRGRRGSETVGGQRQPAGHLLDVNVVISSLSLSNQEDRVLFWKVRTQLRFWSFLTHHLKTNADVTCGLVSSRETRDVFAQLSITDASSHPQEGDRRAISTLSLSLP